MSKFTDVHYHEYNYIINITAVTVLTMSQALPKLIWYYIMGLWCVYKSLTTISCYASMKFTCFCKIQNYNVPYVNVVFLVGIFTIGCVSVGSAVLYKDI